MELEYLVRVPTRIGTIGVLFENNGADLFTFLEVNEHDKQSFRLLGLDPNKLLLAEKVTFERLTGIVINPTSQIEFYDFINRRMETHEPDGNLANIVADTYSSISSIALLDATELSSRYGTKIQEVRNELTNALKHSKKGGYLTYGGFGAGFVLAIAGIIFHSSLNWYTSSAAAILVLGSILYGRRISAHLNASTKQQISILDQYTQDLNQQKEAYQNASTNLMTLKKTLLDTGWFPVGYGR